MSIKFYQAYRTKPGVNIWEALRDLQDKGTMEVRKVLRQLINTRLEGVRPIRASWALHRKYQDQLGNAERNPYDFTVSLSIREYDGRLYILPSADGVMRDTLDFLGDDPRLERYHYWNNTDMPEDLTEEEWHERAKTWGAIIERWHYNFSLPICDIDRWTYVDPALEMEREFHAKSQAQVTEDNPT